MVEGQVENVVIKPVARVEEWCMAHGYRVFVLQNIEDGDLEGSSVDVVGPDLVIISGIIIGIWQVVEEKYQEINGVIIKGLCDIPNKAHTCSLSQHDTKINSRYKQNSSLLLASKVKNCHLIYNQSNPMSSNIPAIG